MILRRCEYRTTVIGKLRNSCDGCSQGYDARGHGFIAGHTLAVPPAWAEEETMSLVQCSYFQLGDKPLLNTHIRKASQRFESTFKQGTITDDGEFQIAEKVLF